MQSSKSHSFHNCPLRSSSLMIVNTEKQTIVTATDEVFTTLGYEPHQLIDKSVEILGLRQEKNHYMLQHESFGQMIPFDICIHHDPMSNAVNLDYWLIRPITTMMMKKKTESTLPATILRLSTFGTIEQAYTCPEFPQKTSELKGRPIMSYVHESDVRFLCEKLCKVRHRKRYYTFEIRWLCKGRGDYDEDDRYIWVEFTVINSPRRRSCSSVYEPQTRPICIIRPIKSNSGSTTAIPIHTLLPKFMLRLAEQSRITDYFAELFSVLHVVLDQGVSYLIEFIAHLLTYTIDVINEFMCYIRGLPQEERASKSFKKQCYHAVKVSLDDSIWLVPLTQKLGQWTRFTSDASLCKPKKN